MPILFKLFLLLINITFLTSCCHKKDCNDRIGPIILNNFSSEDADSIIVKSYQKNSNFTILIDSVFDQGIPTAGQPEKLRVDFPGGFNYDHEYKIEILSIGMTYTLNGFEMNRNECNSCYPWGHDYYSVLDKYYVNGIEKHSDGSGISIDK